MYFIVVVLSYIIYIPIAIIVAVNAIILIATIIGGLISIPITIIKIFHYAV